MQSSIVCLIDINGYTQWCGKRSPLEVCDRMCRFYALIHKYSSDRFPELTVVDTCGDSVLIKCADDPTTRCASCVIEFATTLLREGLEYLQTNVFESRDVSVRMGIHLGVVKMSCRTCLFGSVVNECQRLESVSAAGSVVISKAFVDAHPDSLKVGDPNSKLWVNVDRPVYDTGLKGVDTITYFQALVVRDDLDSPRVTCVRDFLELNLKGNWYTYGVVVCVNEGPSGPRSTESSAGLISPEDTLAEHIREFRRYEARYRTKFQAILVDPAVPQHSALRLHLNCGRLCRSMDLNIGVT